MIFGRKGKEKKGDGSDSPASINRTKRSTKGLISNPVMGVSLKSALISSPSYDGIPVPAVVRLSIDYVMSHGLECEGIYRVCSTKTGLDDLEKAANMGAPLQFEDANDAAGLLRRFLRQLPEPIITPLIKKDVVATTSGCICIGESFCRCDAVVHLRHLLKSLPEENFYLLGYVFLHSQHVILNSDKNKMDLRALGVILQPTLDLTKNEVRILLMNASSLLLKEGDEPITELFGDIVFQTYVRPRTLAELHSVVIVPSEAEIYVELSKQESQLADLNAKIKQFGEKSSHLKLLERKVTEVKQCITFLRRRLKQVNLSISTDDVVNANPSPTYPPSTFLEKQLMAVNSSLEAEVNDEKRQVAELLSRLRAIRSQLPANAVAEMDKQTTPACNSPPKSVVETPDSVEVDELEARRLHLLTEISRYRDLCAQLRARLEQYTVLINTVRLATNDDEIAASCRSVGIPSPVRTVVAIDDGDERNGDVKNSGSLLITRF